MAVRVGINGFGRIGRLVFRVMAEQPAGFRGRRDQRPVGRQAPGLAPEVRQRPRPVQGDGRGRREAPDRQRQGDPDHQEKDPANLPWKALKCQVALESTGFFTNKAALQKHIDAGAERVILSAPAKDKLDATIVLGVNDQTLKPERPDHLQRVVHDQLPGPDGQGAPRGVRHREGPDDDHPRLHQRPARGRPDPLRPVPRPRRGHQHHPLDRPARPRPSAR